MGWRRLTSTKEVAEQVYGLASFTQHLRKPLILQEWKFYFIIRYITVYA
jgi:hypothetical protein